MPLIARAEVSGEKARDRDFVRLEEAHWVGLLRGLCSGQGSVGFHKACHVKLLGHGRLGKLYPDLVPFMWQIKRQLPILSRKRKVLSPLVQVFVLAEVHL